MGVMYEVANGCQINNEGQQVLNIRTREGRNHKITCQVCDANKCLMSVSMLNEAGQQMMFNGHKCYIEDIASGDQIAMVYEDKNVPLGRMGTG